ncbi:alpha/beta hydrolase [Actinomycetospora lutea]|uniref:alpha/beta fold hydrolase n=1 Tax=Actinomycetospora lutea TaxID=663604 RepID=UPI0023655C51|nr:alpha/beta hydrolase [Actinomycetospora lutea]MDD7941731.1 alpha/beta hydrolase [Actinomycetospora lutea]
MPTFTAPDGAHLAYTDVGTGPAVLLLHGWSLDASMWEYQVSALVEAGYRCVTPDRRGHGRSEVTGSGYDLDTLAGDVDALAAHLDLREVTLVAHSMGTCEAVRWLARGTDRVARAVLVGAMTPHLVGVVGPEFVASLVADLRADRPAWFADGAPAYFATRGTGAWVSQALVDDGVRTILRTPLEVQIACLRTFAGTDLTEDLTRVEVPTLVVHGDADASAPFEITGRPTAELLPKARLRLYPGGPHGLYVTAKEAVTADLLDFIATGA